VRDGLRRARGDVQQVFKNNRNAHMEKALTSIELALEQAGKTPGDLKLDTPVVPLVVPDFAVPASEWQRHPNLDNALEDLKRAFNALAQIPGDLMGARGP